MEKYFTHHWCKVPRENTLSWSKFSNFTHPVPLTPFKSTLIWDSGCTATKTGKKWWCNFDLKRKFCFVTFHQWWVVSLQEFLPTVAALWPKIPIRYFRPGCNQMGKIQNFSPGVFCFGTLHQWCIKFISRIFYPFWPPYGRKFRFGTLTGVRPDGTFDQGATRSYAWYFRLWCDQEWFQKHATKKGG